jgi:hypothetical protein
MMIRLVSAIAPPLISLTAMSCVALAQPVPKTPQQGTQPVPNTVQQGTQPVTNTVQQGTQPAPTVSEPNTTQKICSFDSVDNSLPPPISQQSNSPLSYLKDQGFIQNQDGSWVCYVNDSQKDKRYYTLFKVQQINGKLVASTFLDSGNLVANQEKESVDLFMMLITNHTKMTQQNLQSVQRYLETFISLVKQGKIQPSRRAYLFDQPNRGFVIYNALTGGKLKGTAITINIDLPQKLGSTPVN